MFPDTHLPRYTFDFFGWLTTDSFPDRQTTVEPPDSTTRIVGEPFPNFTGHEWIMLPYTDPPEAWELPTPEPVKRYISRFAFRNRLTLEERVTAETAAATSPLIRVLLDDLAVAEYVDLDIPILSTMLAGFEQQGILGVGRATEIITAEIQPHERPTGVA